MTLYSQFFLQLKTQFGRASSLRRRASGVLRVYALLNHHIRRLTAKTGLRCVEGCGRCCDNPRVETSALECLPLAAELWMTGQAQQALALLERSEGRPCVFYKADPLIPGHGRCTVYRYRPLICRLYGFAANRNKKKETVFVGCPMIREAFPKAYEAAEDLSERGSADVPAMSDYGARLTALDPESGRRMLPINQAVKEALVKVGMTIQIKEQEGGENEIRTE